MGKVGRSQSTAEKSQKNTMNVNAVNIAHAYGMIWLNLTIMVIAFLIEIRSPPIASMSLLFVGFEYSFWH